MSARLWRSRAEAAVRVGIAGFLGFGAFRLLVVERDSFLRLGYTDRARLLLGAAELTAAVLAMVPRTFFVGAMGLIVCLAWAAGFHFGLHSGSRALFGFMALLALLMVARSRRASDSVSAA